MSSLDDEPPRLEPVPLAIEVEEPPKMKVVLPPEAGMRPPRIEMLLHSTGLLSLSMAQFHAALDICPQVFAGLTEDNGKNKEKKEDVEHMDQDIVLDGQGEDAADGESKDGGPGTLA